MENRDCVSFQTIKKMLKRLLIFILFPFAINAQEVYTLKRCLEIGLENNYDIRMIRNNQQIADNNATVGNAGYLPSVNLGAGYSGTVKNIKQNLTDGTTVSYDNIHNPTTNVGVNLEWTVFDGFQIQTKYEKLKEFRQAGELNTRLTIEDFIAKLSAEYYNYIRQKLRLGNLKYAVSLSKERLRIVEARYSIGSMSRLDLQQARVDFNADSSKLIKQYEAVHGSCIRLNELMALDEIARPMVVSDSLIEYNPLLNAQTVWENMLRSNFLLLLSEKEIRISELDYKSIQSRNYPYLKLNAGYGYTLNAYNRGNYDKQQTLGFNYGLTLGFTVFDGFNRKREQKNARLQTENMRLSHKSTELMLKAQLSNIWMAYKNNMELTNLEKENLATAKDNYEIAIERYKLGDLSGIELREAQNSLLEAEERLLEARYNTKLCEISLLQISGEISEYLK